MRIMFNYLKNITILLIFLLLGAIGISSFQVHAADVDQEDLENVSWHITAEKGSFDNVKKLYVAQGDVQVTGGATRLEADYIEYNQATQDIFASGNVFLISGEDSLTCKAIDLNLKTQTGKVQKGVLYIKKNNMYIHGEEIRKTGEFTYDATKGYITSCAGEVQDWKISARDIKVTIEGYGFAKNAVVWARQIPALYTPFIAFPVKSKRQTGLLSPKFGSSDRKGYEIDQPFFWAISENTDATVYLNPMSERGVKVGLEYRYVLDNSSRGTVLLDLLDDNKVDDGTGATSDYSFEQTGQRTNTNRYWFRLKADQELGYGFSARLDMDIISDADYLREFETGHTGFEPTRNRFISEFSRSIDEYYDTTRTNQLNINRTWLQHSLNVDFQWFDDVVARREDTDDTTLQSLPAVSFNSSLQPLGHSGVFYLLDSEVTYFYREDTQDAATATSEKLKGFRTDFHPRLFYPLKFSNRINIEPSIGLKGTVWHVEDFKDTQDREETTTHREAWDIRLKASSKLHRVFTPDAQSDVKIKHEIIPTVEYAYTPDIDQDDLPFFDSEDRIEKSNVITYSVINRVITRKPVKPSKKPRPNAQAPFSYKEAAWIKLSQSFYVDDEDNDGREFSDIELDSEFYITKRLSLTSDLSWSPYDNRFNTLNVGSTVRDKRGDSLTIRYRYDRDVSKSIYTKAIVKLTDEYRVYGIYEKDLESEETTETSIGLTIKKSCWSLDLAYTDTTDDSKFGFFITLHGLGGFGSR
ncbi:MAG: LPS-assembly protein LptD [Desulfobacteraceae bacterium]|nr:MAG: LPS-assembly protein LptD [Desulfobacteraceae bacterium]